MARLIDSDKFEEEITDIEGISLITKSEIMKTVPTKFWSNLSVSLFCCFILLGIILSIPASSLWAADTTNVIYYVLASVMLTCFILALGFQTVPPKTREVPTGRYRYIIRIDDIAAIEVIWKNYTVVDFSKNILVVDDKEGVIVQ